ncbi:MAG: response regulator, partial [Phycisphaerales bacterium]
MNERTATDATTFQTDDFVAMPTRALAVCGRPALAASIRRQLSKLGLECETRTDPRRALASLREQPWDLLVVDDAFPSSLRAELVQELRARDAAGAAIWLTQSASVAETVAAMRIGFEDIVSLPLREEELLGRAAELLRKHEHLRRSADRINRWRHVCRRLNQARHEAGRAADEAKHDLDLARAETQRQVKEAAMASEFRTLVRQELEVEGLLRTSMEYLLSKCGPTNAAVFLDNGEGRWTLGAYVNYRIPRGSITAALERIAQQVCPNVAEQAGI